MPSRISHCLVLLLVAGLAGLAAEDRYLVVKAGALTITSGALPRADGERPERWDSWALAEAMQPYAVLDGGGEAFCEPAGGGLDAATLAIAIRVSGAAPPSGHLYLPKADLSGMVDIAFTVPADAPADAAGFARIRAGHYGRLAGAGLPGAAWFRHQQRLAEGRPDGELAEQPAVRRDREGDFDATFDLFSGNRALSENLQLDRELDVRMGAASSAAGANETTTVLGEDETLAALAKRRDVTIEWVIKRNGLVSAPLPGAVLVVPLLAGEDPVPRPADPAGVDLAAIAGITVAEFDWKPLVKDLHPALDPLAAAIPADQHALFFPSFAAMTTLMDEADRDGTPLLSVFETRSEDARTRERYQRQLCLETSELARRFGPQLVASVAVTGSDPYLRAGSDVAFLFAATQPDLLLAFIATRQQQAQAAGAVMVKGSVGAIAYSGVRSPDRAVCSYLARLGGDRVVVTNSLAQLERLAAVAAGTAPALAGADEYRFFRDRYRLDGGEGALLVLSDATIRRWCSPRWRIADSRRTRAAAILAELQAASVDAIVGGGKAAAAPPAAGLGALTLVGDSWCSAIYGTLDFLTPIIELDLGQATAAESAAYGRFRDRYQSNWRGWFDPIALRLSSGGGSIAADLTVMPLIAGSDYNQLIELTRGRAIPPTAGDPHAESIAHVAMALNLETALGREAESFLLGMNPKFAANPFAWLGPAVSLYADADPFWDELAKAESPDRFLEHGYARLPVALQAEVKDVLRLTAFLTALRGMVEQSAPGMVAWETRHHGDLAYVKVAPTATVTDEQPDLAKTAVYYAALPSALILTLDEDVLLRALDRRAARLKAKADGAAPPELQRWLGDSVALHLERPFLDVLRALGGNREFGAGEAMRQRSWANLPILDEWKRRFPDQDPVAVHERLFKARLTCPGGGAYVWNAATRCVESTVYGSPAAPKDGPALPLVFSAFTTGDFGLGFEHDGVRVRLSLDRAGK